MGVVNDGDWDTLRDLAVRLGLPGERFSLLRKLGEARPRQSGPLTLLAGRPDCGIERLLAGWVGLEAVEAVKSSGGAPLVIGPKPATVGPTIGAWPGKSWSGGPPGHLLVLRLPGPPAADVRAQLASLGGVDQAVVVTRLAQPMHMAERELARALSGLAAGARVLIVALPGESPTEDDIAEVTRFAQLQLRHACFGDGRNLGAAVWFSDGAPARASSLTDLSALCRVEPAAVNASRAGMVRQAFSGALREVARKAESVPSEDRPPIDEKESERLTLELRGFLADLGRELERVAADRARIGRPMTDQDSRTYVRDAVHGWGAHIEIEGMWMKYVEALRPGAHSVLLAELDRALAILLAPEIKSTPRPSQAPQAVATAAGSLPIDRLVLEAKRAGVSLACGVVAYGVAASMLTGATEARPLVTLPAVAVTLLSYASLAVGLTLGYVAGARLFRPPISAAPADEPVDLVVPVTSAPTGWTQLERRLLVWFAEYINARPEQPADACRALAGRLGIDLQEETCA